MAGVVMESYNDLILLFRYIQVYSFPHKNIDN